MPEWWVQAFQVVAAIGSALISKSGSDSAANKQKKWRQRAVDEQSRQYDQTREDFAPWREAGGDAINRVGSLLSGDSSSFTKSPGYQFRLDEGTRNLENRFSVSGGGGNAMRALNEYSQNFASNEYGNFFNQNLAAAGLGNSATGATAQAGANSANNISSQYGMLGSDLGSIGLWNAGNQNNALQSGISNLLYSTQKRPATARPGP